MAVSDTRSLGLPGTDTNEVVTVGKYFLFVVAIDEYIKSPLNNPVEDAASIVDILTSDYQFFLPPNAQRHPLISDKYKGRKKPIIEYDSLETKCLYNENATKANIQKHLDAVSAAIGPDDSFLIYCAGHGEYNNARNKFYYIATSPDQNNSGEEIEFSTFYSYFDFYTKGSKCKDLLIIVDCCFAGAISQGGAALVTDSISRRVLTSSLYNQEATDGRKHHGSAFARALQLIFSKNREPELSVDDKKLKEIFEDFHSVQFNKKPFQKILYSQLPVPSGTSEFVFRRKPVEETQHHDLANTIVDYLNFKDQRTDLTNYCHIGKEDKVKYIIVGIISKTDYIQKLQKKVFLKEIKNRIAKSLEFSNPINIEPEAVGLGVWETLMAQFKINDPDLDAAKAKCAQTICNMMLTEEHPINKEAQSLLYYCRFQNEEQAAQIADFCKELIKLIEEAKKLPTNDGNFFKPLVIIIADTREGDAPFLKRETIMQPISKDSRIVVARPVTDILPGLAGNWYDESKKEIRNKTFEGLDIQSFFDEQETYDIESFIMKVAGKLSVDYNLLCAELWNYT